MPKEIEMSFVCVMCLLLGVYCNFILIKKNNRTVELWKISTI